MWCFPALFYYFPKLPYLPLLLRFSPTSPCWLRRTCLVPSRIHPAHDCNVSSRHTLHWFVAAGKKLESLVRPPRALEFRPHLCRHTWLVLCWWKASTTEHKPKEALPSANWVHENYSQVSEWAGVCQGGSNCRDARGGAEEGAHNVREVQP